MQYTTLITRHHDGFSDWDAQQSNWKITNTHWRKDAVGLIAEECHRQGIRLLVYYSLLDWFRDDYPHQTGRTGQHPGRKGHGDYAKYLQFMKKQLTELLTNYGPIAGVWFDGYWNQTTPEGASDRSSWIDWHLDELYALIHQLQPQWPIAHNYHLTPFAGEDFQMFERDLPGENKSGLRLQSVSTKMLLETPETMNGSWGFNITDNDYKSGKDLVRLLVKDAGLGANLLLNIGPMPNGENQPEFVTRLQAMGGWFRKNGESANGTSAGVVKPKSWGAVTEKTSKVYVHVFNPSQDKLSPKMPYKIKNAKLFPGGKAIRFQPYRTTM